jgi:hypothetical protein
MLDRIARQDHDRSAGNTPLHQARGDRLNPGRRLTPRHAAPAIAGALRDQEALWVLTGPRGETSTMLAG